MARGEITVFESTVSYAPPTKGDFLEVVLKRHRPPIESPPTLISSENNVILYDGDRFVVYEEVLPPGKTRSRHGHSQRIVIVLNNTQLEILPDGAPQFLTKQVSGEVRFQPPVTHVVKNVGDKPLRNIAIEFKPSR